MRAIHRFGFSGLVSLIAIAVLALAFGAPAAFAQQGFNFQNFGSTSGLALNGSAVKAGNVLRLTPTATGQAGSAWFNTQQAVTKGFTTSFQFKITNPSEPPADGIAFVIQNSSLTALGVGGGGIGYSGITNSLAVEFDTFFNDPNNDPNANHVAIQSCGTSANSEVHNSDGGCLINITNVEQSLPTFADGNVHTVVVNYDPPCDCDTPNLTIYLDGNTPILTAFFDITSLGLGGEGEDSAFVGFTGATGADFENQDILNWSFTPHNGQTQNSILTFNPGTNVSQTATYDCPSNTIPCTDAEAHSLKLTVGQVKQPFSLVVSATTVDGDGSCESGDSNNPDFDCRFVNHFGTPGITPAVTVPLCDPYNNGHCVYYRVENPPSTSLYLGPVNWYIAWNDDSFVTLGTCAAITVPTTYQCGNRQMADDPSTFHPDPNQFTIYITTFFNSNPNQVGVDPGLGGSTDRFNDVAVVFPQTGPTLLLTLQPPLSGGGPLISRQGPTIPIKFQLKQGNILINNATTPPNSVGIAVLDSNNHPLPIVKPGDPAPLFVLNGNHYQFNLNTSFLAPGTYTLVISSNLFAEQTITLILTP